MNKKRIIFKELLLILTTIIWGLGFVAQNIGGKYLDAFSFNLLRNVVASVVLGLIVIITSSLNKKKNKDNQDYKPNKLSLKDWIGGALTGLALGTAMTFQQIGVTMEGAGKSGFLTALYIVIVPVLGIFMHKKLNKFVIIAIVLALTGLYLINTSEEGFSFGLGSLYLLLCAFAYSIQIILIDKYSKTIDVFKISFMQFFFAMVFMIPFALIFGNMTWELIVKALPAILYLGVLSSGVAYTLQVYAQTEVNVTIACIIMSLESVFSLIFGIICLHEKPGFIQILGCIAIFAAVILSQIEVPNKKLEKEVTNDEESSC